MLRDPSKLLRGAVRYAASPDLVSHLQEHGTTREAMRRHPCHLALPVLRLPERLDRAAIQVLRESATDPKMLAAKAKILNNHLWSRSLPYEHEQKRELYRALSGEPREEQEEEEEEEELQEEESSHLEAVERVMQDHMQHVTKKELSKLVKEKVAEWKPLQYTNPMSQIYMVARLAPNFATACRVLYEIRRRCPQFQPKTLFDFGSGLGTVVWAAHSIWPGSLQEHMLVDASAAMMEMGGMLLRDGYRKRDFCFPGVYQRQFLPASNRPRYDLVVSAHALLDVGTMAARQRVLSTLWGKTEHFLVLVEQGTTAGFKALLEARDWLLSQSTEEDPAVIFAPCPHHLTCGKADSICNFFVKYKKFNLLQPTEDLAKEVFSYLVVSKGSRHGHKNTIGTDTTTPGTDTTMPGTDTTTPDTDTTTPGTDTTMPRIVSYKMSGKVHKGVMHDLCSADGSVKRVVFTKSATDQPLYHFLRYSQPGDLLPAVTIKEDPVLIDDNDEVD